MIFILSGIAQARPILAVRPRSRPPDTIAAAYDRNATKAHYGIFLYRNRISLYISKEMLVTGANGDEMVLCTH